ncbi:hypothetical protein BC629DRAFT_1232182 [Irpex lacteus]|nr:hypothetical protein BC629DRAFT_1232182 [Irpex lacteus]
MAVTWRAAKLGQTQLQNQSAQLSGATAATPGTWSLTCMILRIRFIYSAGVLEAYLMCNLLVMHSAWYASTTRRHLVLNCDFVLSWNVVDVLCDGIMSTSIALHYRLSSRSSGAILNLGPLNVNYTFHLQSVSVD